MAARAIFVGGTASHVGKSWMSTAICRYLRTLGIRVAPFKAQNMSNNSYPCASGGEIGRAQVVQAEACGLEPETDMNPVLLKPSSTHGSQLVVNGLVHGDIAASSYAGHNDFLREQIHAACDRLSGRFEYIVMEGAGSIAEMNLRATDLANLAIAHYAGARGLLVADIDRGGVFASICGTLDLLPPDERALMRSFAVNKFHGDRDLFAAGVAFLESRAGTPCLGVFPAVRDIRIDDEDSVSLEGARGVAGSRIAVIHLPCISNFTDFRLLPCRWISLPDEYPVEWIILPGTKNTIDDLDWLRQQGLADWIQDR
ncbi:MAG: cobyric acid synthase, partial [Candidatus Solibacter usitatus]|nr:cobyric acid synthase [Candidatus Solibacter usitatus]